MDNTSEASEIIVKVARKIQDGRELATVLFEGLEDGDGQQISVNLTESDVTDIKALFDSIFAKIYESKAMLKFQLDDSRSDLYNQVAKDIIEYLEREIEQSQGNFEKIWQLVDNESENE